MSPRNTKRRATTSVLAAASALLLVLGTSQPAQAAGILARGDVCQGGVCGSATFTFSGSSALTGISMSVRDTACDANDVYIRLRIHDSQGHFDTQQRRNSNGCGAGYVEWHGLRFDNPRAIHSVQVVGCVDDAGGDTCYFSPSIDNPNV
jgi:hypothetical protein